MRETSAAALTTVPVPTPEEVQEAKNALLCGRGTVDGWSLDPSDPWLPEPPSVIEFGTRENTEDDGLDQALLEEVL